MIKRVLLVFTNVSARTGQGLNWGIEPVEEARMKLVIARLESMFQLGNTFVLGEYPSYALKTASFLAENLTSCTEGEGFVSLRGLLEKVRGAKTSPETLLISCLSFHTTDLSGNESFHRYFHKWWDEHCALCGMSPIPRHERDGDRSVLVIDYERREVYWINNIGEAAEARTEATVSA